MGQLSHHSGNLVVNSVDRESASACCPGVKRISTGRALGVALLARQKMIDPIPIVIITWAS